jgi:hypothetical protein
MQEVPRLNSYQLPGKFPIPFPRFLGTGARAQALFLLRNLLENVCGKLRLPPIRLASTAFQLRVNRSPVTYGTL